LDSKKKAPPTGGTFSFEREGILRGDYQQETGLYYPASRFVKRWGSFHNQMVSHVPKEVYPKFTKQLGYFCAICRHMYKFYCQNYEADMFNGINTAVEAWDKFCYNGRKRKFYSD